MKIVAMILGCVVVALCLLVIAAWKALPLNATVLVNVLVGLLVAGIGMLIAGGLRVMGVRLASDGAPRGERLRMFLRGWALAGAACVLIAFLVLPTMSGNPPEGVTKEFRARWMMEHVRVPILFMAMGAALIGVNFLTVELKSK